MFGIGWTELVLILLFAFLIFGPDKLPQVAKTVGRAIAKFRDAQNEVSEVIRSEVYDPASDKDDPFKKPLEKLSKLDRNEPESTETFAERKARYDKERAARKAAEKAAAQNEGQAGEAAASEAPASAAVDSASSETGAAPATQDSPKEVN